MKRLRCWLFGHEWYVVQAFSSFQFRLHCPRCGRQLAMNDDSRLAIPWDAELERMYRDLGHVIVKPWRSA